MLQLENNQSCTVVEYQHNEKDLECMIDKSTVNAK